MIEVGVEKVLGNFVLKAELEDSGFICLTGRNGSGKSTLLNIIAGSLAPDRGTVIVSSKDITALPIEKREVVLVTPDSSIPHLQVDQHLLWGARVRRIKVSDAYLIEVASSLGVPRSGRVRELSVGMRERVALATALISRPKVILVDEAFASIDNRDEFIQNYNKLSGDANIDVVFATQNTDTDVGLADHSYRMENGQSARLF